MPSTSTEPCAKRHRGADIWDFDVDRDMGSCDTEDGCDVGCCHVCGDATLNVCDMCGSDWSMEIDFCECDCTQCNHEYDICYCENKMSVPKGTLFLITILQAYIRGHEVRSRYS